MTQSHEQPIANNLVVASFNFSQSGSQITTEMGRTDLSPDGIINMQVTPGLGNAIPLVRPPLSHFISRLGSLGPENEYRIFDGETIDYDLSRLPVQGRLLINAQPHVVEPAVDEVISQQSEALTVVGAAGLLAVHDALVERRYAALNNPSHNRSGWNAVGMLMLHATTRAMLETTTETTKRT